MAESRKAAGESVSEDNQAGQASETRFNVLNHVNVPLHVVLSDDEAKELLAKYKIVKEQLPKVKNTDPAVKVVDGKPGQIVRVTRKSPTAGSATAYRLIIEAI